MVRALCSCPSLLSLINIRYSHDMWHCSSCHKCWVWGQKPAAGDDRAEQWEEPARVLENTRNHYYNFEAANLQSFCCSSGSIWTFPRREMLRKTLPPPNCEHLNVTLTSPLVHILQRFPIALRAGSKLLVIKTCNPALAGSLHQPWPSLLGPQPDWTSSSHISYFTPRFLQCYFLSSLLPSFHLALSSFFRSQFKCLLQEAFLDF